MAPKTHEAYIAAAPEYARPILEKLRRLVHQSIPDVTESVKWSAPCFDGVGIVAGMAAFKEHVAFRVWRGVELDDPKGLLEPNGKSQMATIKFRSVKEIPVGALKALLRQAAKLDAAGPSKSPPKPRKAPVASPPPPADFLAALSKQARTRFDGMAPSHRRDYVQWIVEAKREATRQRRIAQAAEWIAEGKHRNWKYER